MLSQNLKEKLFTPEYLAQQNHQNHSIPKVELPLVPQRVRPSSPPVFAYVLMVLTVAAVVLSILLK